MLHEHQHQPWQNYQVSSGQVLLNHFPLYCAAQDQSRKDYLTDSAKRCEYLDKLQQLFLYVPH